MPLLACLLVPRLPVACAIAEEPSLRGQPIAITTHESSTIVSVSREAERAGVRVGMLARIAPAVCRDLVVLEQRGALIACAAEALDTALGTVSSLIEESAPGELYADVSGLDGPYPTPGELEQAVLAAAPAALEPRVGVGGARFTALMAARTAKPGGFRASPT